MSSYKAELPLNPVAVRQADNQFYANHPELVKDGKRIPLEPDSPAQAGLRGEWLDLYDTKNKKQGPVRPDKKPNHICIACSAELVVRVVDQDGKPVEGATVKADGLTRSSDASGYADFGSVPSKEYKISASKNGYREIFTYPDTVNVPLGLTTRATLGLEKCVIFNLTSPRLIARGSEGLTPPITSFDIPGSVGGPLKLDFGQDFTFGTGGKLVSGIEVGGAETGLKTLMSTLLDGFAWDDPDKKAEKEYGVFQSKKNKPEIYTDPNLNKAVPLSEKFKDYPTRVLAAPPTMPPAGKIRIHQALAATGWNINAVKEITDLGVPALDAGDNPGLFSKSTKDRATGLFTLIDSVTHVLVFVTRYEYDSCKQEYIIELVFELYDMFGLDDEDIRKFGYDPASFDLKHHGNKYAMAITAWWQLQHQKGYAPLVTKVVVKPAPFTVSVK